MKNNFVSNFKKTLMAGVVTGMLMTSAPSVAGSWIGAAGSAAGLLITAVTTYMLGGEVVHVLPGNIDPAQLVAEGLVLYQMYNIKDTWEPEPQEEYQKAAESNGGGCSGGSGGSSYDSMTQKLPFQVAALQNVGIEAIGVGTMLAEIGTIETRSKIFEDLEWMQLKSAASSTTSEETDEIPGAGSCAAKYSVCSKYSEMSPEERDQVVTRQTQNEQNFGTAGIAHAELGLKSVQQAIANDGGSSVGKTGTSSSAENATFVMGKTTTVQNLSGMIGTGANTVAAMKIVSLMNLELAQRLNQGNMLQGSALAIEAARAIPDTVGLTD